MSLIKTEYQPLLPDAPPAVEAKTSSSSSGLKDIKKQVRRRPMADQKLPRREENYAEWHSQIVLRAVRSRILSQER